MDVIARMTELLAAGETFCAATVVAAGAAGARPGARVLVHAGGVLEGSLGSAELDRRVAALGAESLERRTRRLAEPVPDTRVFFDVFSPEARLVICGAGHIALALARFGLELGFSVTVVDDRPDFAHPSRFPGCEVVARDFVETLRADPLGPSAYVVVITRGHEHDAECLVEVLAKETAYVGLIGSRRRVRFVREQLEREGARRERLDDLFTPIGLPIGGESPAEIALSIASELVCARRLGAEATRRLREARGDA